MPEPRSAVLAGSKAFVDALHPQLRVRLGVAPRVARDPQELVKACNDGGAILVVESAGQEWLEAVMSVRTVRDRKALAIVAAVPSSRTSDIAALQSAGVDEAVRCDARVDPVVWALDRVVASRPKATPPPTPAAAPVARAAGAPTLSPVPVAAVAAAPGGAAAVVPAEGEVVDISDLTIDESAAAPAVLTPADLPPPPEAEQLLASAVAGSLPVVEALREFTSRFLGQLTDVERSALAGAPLPIDGAALRACAALRWRVAAVLEHAKAAGAPDPAAAQRLPAEIDAALTALKTIADAAAPDVQRVVIDARNALVSEAIQLTEAIARALEVPAAPAAPAPTRTIPGVRLLSNDKAEGAAGQTQGRKWIALVVVLLVGAGYHGVMHALHLQRLARRPVVANVPANASGVERGAGKIITSEPGKTVSAADIEKFKAAEKAKGNLVKEIAPGTWLSYPEPQAAQHKPGGTP